MFGFALRARSRGGAPQLYAGAVIEKNTSGLPAAAVIIDLISVALVEVALCTETPDSLLNEAGEYLRVVSVEPASVDERRYPSYDILAVTVRVASRSILVLRLKASQDAASMQPVMHQ